MYGNPAEASLTPHTPLLNAQYVQFHPFNVPLPEEDPRTALLRRQHKRDMWNKWTGPCLVITTVLIILFVLSSLLYFHLVEKHEPNNPDLKTNDPNGTFYIVF